MHKFKRMSAKAGKSLLDFATEVESRRIVHTKRQQVSILRTLLCTSSFPSLPRIPCYSCPLPPPPNRVARVSQSLRGSFPLVLIGLTVLPVFLRLEFPHGTPY